MTPHVLGQTDINLAWIALAVVLAAAVLSRLRPTWGMGTLLVPGAATVAYVVFRYASQAGSDTTGRLWPVFLAGAMFLYLWWLVALLFDLTFVWHLASFIPISRPVAGPTPSISVSNRSLSSGSRPAMGPTTMSTMASRSR